MRGLFFKIFIIFWIAQSLIFVISTALILGHRFPRSSYILDPAFSSVRLEASQALQSFERNGCAGFENFARDRHEKLALADGTGAELCGQVMPDYSGQVGAAGEIYGRKIDDDTVWVFPVSSADGKMYRFLLSVHHEQHSWYSDLIHWANPQLPVAIAVGGVTTFVLVLVFTRPLTRLRTAARQLARGNLDARVPEKPQTGASFKGDEFDALVHDFNHMAERLQSLVDAQKLLLRDVSHELRSPLARLSVALELSREDADQEMSAHLDRIERETERLNQLIGQLLTLSSMEAVEDLRKLERVVLKQLLEEILPDAEYEAQQHNASIELDASCDCAVSGRRELIYRALENVVRNAIRYTAAGTAIEITLQKEETGRHAQIEVSDRGPGIPESELESIFRPFYRVDTARSAQTGGFGVGLAIADRAIKLHNGSIQASNRSDGGTTIRIMLPLAE